MKALRLFALGAALFALAAYGTIGAAQDEQPKKKGQFQQGQGFGGRGAALLSTDALDKLKLTAEQKQKYDTIASDFADKAKASGEKVREAFQSQDKDKIRETLQGLRADAEKLRTDALGKVEALLTADQKKVLDEVKNQRGGPGGPGGAFGGGRGAPGQVLSPGLQERLGLSAEQKKKIEDLQKDIDTKINSILTDDQRKQFDELKKGGGPGGNPGQGKGRPKTKDA